MVCVCVHWEFMYISIGFSCQLVTKTDYTLYVFCLVKKEIKVGIDKKTLLDSLHWYEEGRADRKAKLIAYILFDE